MSAVDSRWLEPITSEQPILSARPPFAERDPAERGYHGETTYGWERRVRAHRLGILTEPLTGLPMSSIERRELHALCRHDERAARVAVLTSLLHRARRAGRDQLPDGTAEVFAELRAAITRADQADEATRGITPAEAPAAHAVLADAFERLADVADRLVDTISAPDGDDSPMAEIAAFALALAERHIRATATIARDLSALSPESHQFHTSWTGEQA